MFVRFAVAASPLLLLAGLAPVGAQPAYNDKTLVVFGNDRCPTGTICVRAPESERYRIPKTIRDTTPSPSSGAGAQRELAASTAAVSASGTGSCTTTGPGGYIGCWSKAMRDAKAERKAEAAGTTPPQ